MKPPRSLLVITVTAVCLLASQGAATWLLVEQSRTAALATAGQTVKRTLGTAAANINRGFLQVDALLSGLESLVAPSESADPAVPNRKLRNLSDQNFLVRELMIVGVDGRVVASGLEATRRHPPALKNSLLADDAPPHSGLIVGDPLRNRLTGEWSLYVGRAGRWLDEPVVVVAEIPLSNIAQVALPETTTAGLRVSLERTNGQLLMSNPHDARNTGQILGPVSDRLTPGGPWAPIEGRVSGRRVIAAATPTLHEGLVLVVQLTEDEALANWRETRRVVLIASAALAAVVVLLAVGAVLYLRARDRAAASLRWSKRLLDQALDAMSEGLAVYDANWTLVLTNRRYVEIFPHLRDVAVPGMPFERLARQAAAVVLPEGTEAERETWAEWRRRAHEGSGSFEQTFPSGLTVQSTQAEMPDGGVVSVHRDVTAAKRAEEHLRAARDTAERANRMKSEFLSNMSHELRTPLNAIIGFAEVLERNGAVPEPVRIDYARDIRLSGEHLLAIINDVLDMSKLDAGAMILHESVCDLRRLVGAAGNMLREQARAAGVTLRVMVPEEPLPVLGDERLLRQVVLNLVSNAIKFTGCGGTVDVAVVRAEAGGLQVTVIDNGVGIAPEHLPNIFQPFYQVDGTASRQRGGTGLGLPISRAIMRMHDGQLEITSAPGVGTIAVVILPAARCAANRADEVA
ncbi:ATP-binding protein [Azospirillum canadense]|uniref:ATP-binding protein n=1 Tax=Azospirillum canadense TaxID=403962 RepID=UPI00222642AD|nr:ATP-binding protein [Azospirillum canadense]MCW2239852.1 signal transduction histidine kinase [Azospirillum canadense]